MTDHDKPLEVEEMYWDGDDLVIKTKDGRTVSLEQATVVSHEHIVPDNSTMTITPMKINPDGTFSPEGEEGTGV